jgi:hypothetical protein
MLMFDETRGLGEAAALLWFVVESALGGGVALAGRGLVNV